MFYDYVKRQSRVNSVSAVNNIVGWNNSTFERHKIMLNVIQSLKQIAV